MKEATTGTEMQTRSKKSKTTLIDLRNLAEPVGQTRKRTATTDRNSGKKRKLTNMGNELRGVRSKNSAKNRLFTDGHALPQVGYAHHVQWYISPHDPRFRSALSSYVPGVPDILLSIDRGVKVNPQHYQTQKAMRDLIAKKMNVPLKLLLSLRGWIIMIDKNDKISVRYQLFKHKASSIKENCDKNEDALWALSFNYDQVIANVVFEINNYQSESGSHVTQIKTKKNKINNRWCLQQLQFSVFNMLFENRELDDIIKIMDSCFHHCSNSMKQLGVILNLFCLMTVETFRNNRKKYIDGWETKNWPAIIGKEF